MRTFAIFVFFFIYLYILFIYLFIFCFDVSVLTPPILCNENSDTFHEDLFFFLFFLCVFLLVSLVGCAFLVSLCFSGSQFSVCWCLVEFFVFCLLGFEGVLCSLFAAVCFLFYWISWRLEVRNGMKYEYIYLPFTLT